MGESWLTDSDGTPLTWWNKNTAPVIDPIPSNAVDAYSVIMHEWGHWFALKDATNIADTSFISFPFHFAGKTEWDIAVGDVNKARWMYSDSVALIDTTAPNYNGNWAEHPGAPLITQVASNKKYFEWASWQKWHTLYEQTQELASLGRRIHDQMSVEGSIVRLAGKHKKELLCWAVIRPDLFTQALNIVLKYKSCLM